MANENMNAGNSASQTKRILAYMQAGHSITPYDALRMFSCMRLGARIADIAEIIGYPPRRKRVKVTNIDGKEVYVMSYSL